MQFHANDCCWSGSFFVRRYSYSIRLPRDLLIELLRTSGNAMGFSVTQRSGELEKLLEENSMECVMFITCSFGRAKRRNKRYELYHVLIMDKVHFSIFKLHISLIFSIELRNWATHTFTVEIKQILLLWLVL